MQVFCIAQAETTLQAIAQERQRIPQPIRLGISGCDDYKGRHPDPGIKKKGEQLRVITSQGQAEDARPGVADSCNLEDGRNEMGLIPSVDAGKVKNHVRFVLPHVCQEGRVAAPFDHLISETFQAEIDLLHLGCGRRIPVYRFEQANFHFSSQLHSEVERGSWPCNPGRSLHRRVRNRSLLR